MWLFLNNAFLSIVAVSPRAKDLPLAVARERAGFLLVRARIEGDIERVFADASVRRTENRDYRYRALVARDEVARRVAEAITQIAYSSFKSSIPSVDAARHDAYLTVWETMWRFQQASRVA